MTNNELKNKLQVIADSTENAIEKQVALEALDRDNIRYFFSDLLNNGCVSGMINSLVYYNDSNVFFDTHYFQIKELLNEYEVNCDASFIIKNDLAWLAFEKVAYKMAQELGLKV